MIKVNADEIYFIIPHYEDLNGIQKLIPNLLSYGAKKIGIYDGPFVTFEGGSGEDISNDGSLGYLNNIKEVEIFKMGRCWMEQKLSRAFTRASHLGFKYAMLLGADEWLEGDFEKFTIATDQVNVASMPFREHHVDEMYNRDVVLMHRFFINPGELETKTSHYEYFVKNTGKRVKHSTMTSGSVEIHHDDRIRDEKRNKDMEEFQTKNKVRENENRANEYENINKFKLYLAVPNNGNIHPELGVWLINMQHSLNKIPQYEGLVIDLRMASPVDNARNIIVKNFLQSDCTHLLMIDSDIVPTYGTIEKLFIANKDVIGPKMPIWMGIEKGLTYPAHSEKDDENTNLKGIREVDFIGTGCILVKRKVIQDTFKPLFRFIVDHDGIVVKPEDNFFCNAIRKAGFKIFVHQDITVKHFRQIELSEINSFIIRHTQTPREVNSKKSILHVFDCAGVSYILAKYQRKLGHEANVIQYKEMDPFEFGKFYGNEALDVSTDGFYANVLQQAENYDVIHVHFMWWLVPQLRQLYPDKIIAIHYHGGDVRRAKNLEELVEAQKYANYLFSSGNEVYEMVPNSIMLPQIIDTDNFNKKQKGKGKFLIYYKMMDFDLIKKMLVELNIKEVDLINRDENFRPHKEMKELYQNYSTYVDIRYSSGKLLKALSKTALECLACGLKVIDWNGKIHEKLPDEHTPEKIMGKIPYLK